MAYRILYTPENNRRYPPCRSKQNIRYSSILGFIFFLLSILWIRVYGIPDFLIPGDTEVTKSAAREMISLLKTGTPVKDAVTVFCKQIIDAAVV